MNEPDIVSIPLNKLRHSDDNVRTDRSSPAMAEADAELRASILANGLEQNLVVVPKTKTLYGVVAGARRLDAMTELAKAGDLPRDLPVPCRIVDVENAAEHSLAENVVRVAMSPSDQAAAFARLAKAGADSDQIAARFGVPQRTVNKRVRLGMLHPDVFQAYREGRISQQSAEAYATTADEDLQSAVFKALSANNRHYPHDIREALNQDRARSDSDVAEVVGLDAYRAAGGRVEDPLFEEDHLVLLDPDILLRLAHEKLDETAEPFKTDWKWVETRMSWGWGDDQDFLKASPRRKGVPTAEEEAEHDRLGEVISNLQETVDDWENFNIVERQKARAEQNEAIAAANAIEYRVSLRDVHTKRTMRHGGVVVCIHGENGIVVKQGLIRREDAAAYNADAAKTPNAGDGNDGTGDDDASRPAANESGYSAAFSQDLGYLRTIAVRRALARNPQVAMNALAFVVAKFAALEGRYESYHSPFNMCRDNDYFTGSEKLAGHDAMQQYDQLPDASMEWADLEDQGESFQAFCDLPPDQRGAVAAAGLANLLNSYQADHMNEPDMHAVLVEQLDIDFPDELRAAGILPFDPDLVWNRMSKAQIRDAAVEAGLDPLHVQDLSQRKKKDFAAAVAQEIGDHPTARNWLPPQIAGRPQNDGPEDNADEAEANAVDVDDSASSEAADAPPETKDGLPSFLAD